MKAATEQLAPKHIPQENLIRMLSQISTISSQEVISSEKGNELRDLYLNTLLWIDQNHSDLDNSQNYQLIEYLHYYLQVDSKEQKGSNCSHG